jgi:hypothetical protein
MVAVEIFRCALHTVSITGICIEQLVNHIGVLK